MKKPILALGFVLAVATAAFMAAVELLGIPPTTVAQALKGSC